MSRINKFALIGVALVALGPISTGAAAQGARVRPARAGHASGAVSIAAVPVEVLASELKITPAQQEKIQEIRKSVKEQMKTLRPAPGTPPDPATQQKRRDLTKQAAADITAVLTPEQQSQAPALLRKLRIFNMAGIPLIAYTAVKLTPDQTTKIEGIIKDATVQVRALPLADRRAQGPQIIKDARAKAAALLTDEQKAAIAQLTSRHHHKANKSSTTPAPAP